MLTALGAGATATAAGFYLRNEDVPGAWPSFGGGPDNGGTASTATGPTDDPSVAWSGSIGRKASHAGGVAVADGVGVALVTPGTFGGRFRGRIEAFGAGADERWSVSISSAIRVTPLLADGAAFVPGGDGTLHAFDLASGDVRWRQSLPERPVTHPRRLGESVLVGTADGALLTCDGSGVDVLWETDEAPETVATPAVSDGLVVGAVTDFVVGIDHATGEEVWRQPTAADEPHAPVLGDDRAFVASGSNVRRRLQAIALESGEEEWVATEDAVFGRSPTLVGETLVAGVGVAGSSLSDGGIRVVGYDPADGTRRWTRDGVDDLHLIPDARVAGAEGRAFVGGVGGQVYALDAATGETVWRTDEVREDAVHVRGLAVADDALLGIDDFTRVVAIR